MFQAIIYTIQFTLTLNQINTLDNPENILHSIKHYEFS